MPVASVAYVANCPFLSRFSMERQSNVTFTCFQTTSEKEDNRMKNVPVPVYCRPLVEKDPNRKVRRSAASPGKKKKGTFITTTKIG